MTEHATDYSPTLDRIQRRALIAGVVGLILWALSMLFTPQQQVMRSYLLAYIFWFGMAIGSFAILMLQHVTGGRWGLAIRRLLESASRLLPLMAIFFIPLIFGLRPLYIWTEHHSWYLNIPFFLGRALLYFVIWLTFAFLLNRWSYEQDHSSDPRIARKLQLLSGPGLLLYGLTVTFAAVDWVMSLDPEWYSTIYGMIFMTGQALGSLALMTAVLALLSRYRPLSEMLDRGIFNDLGNLLLTFTMLWAYTSFSQYLIIWSGNIAEETPYYVYRTHGGWQAVALFLIIFHFFVPFMLLLSRRTKRSVRDLSTLAIAIVVLRLVDLHWTIVPQWLQGQHKISHEAQVPRFALHWLDIVAPIGIGGIWIAAFLWQVKKRPLLPVHDPRLKEVSAHHG